MTSPARQDRESPPVVDDPCQSDAQAIEATLNGKSSAFEFLVKKYQPRVFATARRYARRESEVEDIAQEVFFKAYQKLDTYRGEAPFEHWLMRMAVRICFDFLRRHQRNRESSFTDLGDQETGWLEACLVEREDEFKTSEAARQLVARILEQLAPAARLIITLLEIEERPIKEIAEMTGWSIPVVKIRAFRARAQMKKLLAKMAREKYM